MAEIYLKSAENTLILEPREYMLRQFDFGAWTEMRMGLYYGGVSASDNDGAGSAEQVANSTALDLLSFGIKDSSTALPGTTGSLFLGVGTGYGNFSSTSAATTFGRCASGDGSSQQVLAAVGYYDTNLLNGTYPADNLSSMTYPSPTGTTGYCGFFGLKFVVTDIGLSSQTVTISSVVTSPISGSTYTLAALRTLLNNSTYGTGRVVDWNDGASARVIPNCCFLHLPFYNNRIRISAIDMIKFA